MTKIIITSLIVGLMLSSGGCATSVVLNKANPKKFHFASTKPDKNAVAAPGYFALLPLSVALDAALFPIYHIVAVVGVVAFCRIKENRKEAEPASASTQNKRP